MSLSGQWVGVGGGMGLETIGTDTSHVVLLQFTCLQWKWGVRLVSARIMWRRSIHRTLGKHSRVTCCWFNSLVSLAYHPTCHLKGHSRNNEPPNLSSQGHSRNNEPPNLSSEGSFQKQWTIQPVISGSFQKHLTIQAVIPGPFQKQWTI